MKCFMYIDGGNIDHRIEVEFPILPAVGHRLTYHDRDVYVVDIRHDINTGSGNAKVSEIHIFVNSDMTVFTFTHKRQEKEELVSQIALAVSELLKRGD